jgi:hypothetical protein
MRPLRIGARGPALKQPYERVSQKADPRDGGEQCNCQARNGHNTLKVRQHNTDPCFLPWRVCPNAARLFGSEDEFSTIVQLGDLYCDFEHTFAVDANV